ncbi:MAG TPA: hypothetical protein VFU04_03090 [Solirubrobacterales bacterium]|nr:hypothetical protein [Solirubrobacterales bacterium]
MRAEVAPFAVDLLLALAGLGILLAIGLVPRRPSGVLAALGLAYLTGASVVPVVLIALVVIGVPFTLEAFGVVVLLCIGAGALRWRAGPEERIASREAWWRKPWRSWSVDAWAAGAFIALFGVFAVVGMLSAFEMPLTVWDAWSIWARKAQMLTEHDSLISGFWSSSSYSWTHLDYPILYPVWEALHFRAAGEFDSQAILRHVWLFLVAFVWAVAFLMRGRVRPVVWAPLLLLAAAAPGVWQQLLTGYADVPMAIFACLGAMSLALWLSDGDGRFIALATIMLAAAANAKNEGLMVVVALLLVAGAISVVRRFRLPELLIASGVVVLSILPWRAWTSVQGIEGDLPISKGITDPGYMIDRIDRVWPAIESIGNQLADQAQWLQLLPLAALVVAVSLISAVGRRVAIFYLAAFAVVWAGLVWSYWISPNPLDWHLGTSANRIVSVLVLICLAAVVHLSGLLLDALGQRRDDAASD